MSPPSRKSGIEPPPRCPYCGNLHNWQKIAAGRALWKRKHPMPTAWRCLKCGWCNR